MRKKYTKVEEIKTRRKVVPANQKNKRKHTKKILRVLVYIILVVFMLSLLFLLGYGVYKVWTSTRYTLAMVNFENNEKYTYEELREAIGLADGTNMHKISRSRLEKKLEELPYIYEAKVSKKYPDTLQIKIVEYEPYFLAYNAETNRYVKLTKDGIILEECDSIKKGDNELFVFGINFDDELGKSIVEVEKTKLTNYLTIKEQYDLTKIDKEITSVEFKEGNVILTLDQDINVIMNTNDIGYKLSFLKSILNEISGKAGSIDMRVENPIFREAIK